MKKRFLIIVGSGLFLTLIFLGSLYIFSFRLNGKSRVEINYGEVYKDLGCNVSIFSKTLNKYLKVESNVDTSKIGKYKVIYKLPFKTLIREVFVVDNISPELTLNGDDVITLSIGANYEESGYKATDNVDLDLTNKVEIENNLDNNKIGEYEIIYRVKDSSNNKTEKKRTIKVIDDIAPVILLKGATKVIVKVNENYDDQGYSANDNLDGDLTSKVKVTRNVDFSKIGTYEIVYEVIDKSNNKTVAKRIVEVIENIEITYIKGILLVNKKYHLPYNYNPGVNQEAYNHLLSLQNDAMAEGHSLPLLSGFRSYETQKYLFNSYVQKDGLALASTYSARPGQSEHQTGLAFDVGRISDSFGDTPAGIWLKDNCYKYGFIIRYLKGKESITGYKYEPWHIRYVGVSAATEIHNLGVTLEEYLGV